jgi:hypothetical protein
MRQSIIMKAAWEMYKNRLNQDLPFHYFLKKQWGVDRLKRALEKGEASFKFFKKSNGELREAVGTRNLDLIPEHFHPKHVYQGQKPEEMVITFFDLENSGWRSFVRTTVVL